MKKPVKLKPKKKVFVPEIQVNKNEKLINPKNGSTSFGFVEITDSSPSLIEGEIFLPHGEAYSYRNGFGAEHIWRKHANDMKAAGFETRDDVSAYVAEIIREGSLVQSEFDKHGEAQDLKVVRNPIGLAILKYKGRPNFGFYQVITAFRKDDPDGNVVGTIRDKIM